MPCYQAPSQPPSGNFPVNTTGYATEAECLEACKEGACCNGTTCSVKPQCQCNAAAGEVFKGVGTVCSPNPCLPCPCPGNEFYLPESITFSIEVLEAVAGSPCAQGKSNQFINAASGLSVTAPLRGQAGWLAFFPGDVFPPNLLNFQTCDEIQAEGQYFGNTFSTVSGYLSCSGFLQVGGNLNQLINFYRVPSNGYELCINGCLRPPFVNSAREVSVTLDYLGLGGLAVQAVNPCEGQTHVAKSNIVSGYGSLFEPPCGECFFNITGRVVAMFNYANPLP